MTENAYTCPGCGNTAAFHSIACPLCGYWIPRTHVPDRSRTLGNVMLVVVLLVLLGMIF